MSARMFARSLFLVFGITAGGIASSQVLTSAEFPGGGWGVIESPEEHISEEQERALRQTIVGNINMLRAQGKLATLKADRAQRYSWPTRLAQGRPEFQGYAVSNYIDQDPAGNSVRDFSCGTRTYNFGAPGTGHKGTDIGLGFRPFYLQDSEQVVVVAAAEGTIVAKVDTQPDRSCGDLAGLLANTRLTNNVISIRHADGTVAHYYHIKTGSLTAKNIGDAVVEGEYLATIGSAGFSSGPHLHFELRGPNNEVMDPWAGACNATTKESLWKSQESYYVPEILELMPSSMTPDAQNMGTTCNNSVADKKPASGYLQPNLHAQPGVQHNFVAFLRDIDAGSQVVLALKRPNGSQYAAMTVIGPGYSPLAYVYVNGVIPGSEPAGKWSFAVTYGGKTKAVPFYFNVPKPAPVRVYEFYNRALGHYFRTASALEAQSLTPASGFLPTGDDFFALDRTVALAGVSPACRFYGSVDPGPNSHFYTADRGECALLKNLQGQIPPSNPRWNYEETAFAAYVPVEGVCPAEAPIPLYRLYNQGGAASGKQGDSNHRFTTLSSVYNQMGMQGWIGEGVVMCAVAKP